MIRIQRALISCWDKTGLENLCKSLKHFNIEIISSMGTAEYLKRHHIPVTVIEQITGFPEILDGRVKTLHPAILGGLLADQSEEHKKDLEKIDTQPIQLVVVNLYPFVEKAVKENLPLNKAIEFIDIGGPTMLRAAAKNYQNVVVLNHPSQYDSFAELLNSNQGQIPVDYSQKRARDIFFYTSWYDSQIQDYFGQKSDTDERLPKYKSILLAKREELRYGENPHQAAAFYQEINHTPFGLDSMEQLWGKQLSFNNYMDVNAAYELVLEFRDPAVAIIKHMNPCGAAIGKKGLSEAFDKARQGDPISAFGGIVALNRRVDVETARSISETFFECIIAPDYENSSLEILQKKKNLRLLRLSPDNCKGNDQEIKSVNGAYLIQETDKIEENNKEWQVVTEKQPSSQLMEDVTFLWKVCKHVKSNAIVVGKDYELYGVGAGQMSRVDSVEIAISKANKAGRQLENIVLASDAFFPFRDGIDRAAEAGVSAVIQPGGSIRDEEVIQAANEHGLIMFFTKTRHFRH